MACCCKAPLLALPRQPHSSQSQCRLQVAASIRCKLTPIQRQQGIHRPRFSSTLPRSISTEREETELDSGDSGDGGPGGDDDESGGFNWISNLPVFFLWAGLAAYAFSPYSPNQTPYRDQLFLEKLLFLRGDEGFSLNPVLVFVWYSMGLLPLIYLMLLIPSGRSAKGGVPVWPFSAASFFVGIFALLPYFGVWNPPPPRVTKEELQKFPLVVLESKTLSGLVVAGAVALAVKAALCSGESLQQYWNFFRESRFIHVMSIDFVLLNLLTFIWVSNDMAVRRCKASWLTFLSVLPLVGPALYLLLRPGLPPLMIED